MHELQYLHYKMITNILFLIYSAGTTNTTGSNFIDGPRNSPQSNNDTTDKKIEDSDKSIRSVYSCN